MAASSDRSDWIQAKYWSSDLQVLVTRSEGIGGIKNETQISCLSNYEEIGAIYGDEEDQPGTELGGTIRRVALSMLGQSYLGRSGCRGVK